MSELRQWITLLSESEADIAVVIRDEIIKTGMSPKRINDGWCYEFANYVVRRLGGSVVESDVHLDPSLPPHCFVELNGRYYDAENPQGVNDWHNLRFFKREMRKSTPEERIAARNGERQHFARSR